MLLDPVRDQIEALRDLLAWGVVIKVAVTIASPSEISKLRDKTAWALTRMVRYPAGSHGVDLVQLASNCRPELQWNPSRRLPLFRVR
jgi:hypothetical protein